MDNKKYMIVAKGEIITNKVIKCITNSATQKYEITFDNGSTYSYLMYNVLFMEEPAILDPKHYDVATPDGKNLFGIQWIYEFTGGGEKFWHIVFDDFELDYKKSELEIRENCLKNEKSEKAFDYLKEVASLSNIRNDKDELVLSKYYANIDFIRDDTVLSKYLNPEEELANDSITNVIFPFGCNQSQYKAVRSAFENQISVIQGPPGTGKTQTILNIIANILIRGQNVVIVSNNNSATLNVLEKLEKYGMGFLVAPLGNSDNKSKFIAGQNGEYPDFSDWKLKPEDNISLDEVDGIVEKLQKIYELQENIAKLKEYQYKIKIESEHFFKYVDDTGADNNAIKVRRKMSSNKVMRLWQKLQNLADNGKTLSFCEKLKSIFIYGIADWNFYKQDLSKIITVLQGLYYKQSLTEIQKELEDKESELTNSKGDYEKQLEDKSLRYLKSVIATRYSNKEKREIFEEGDLFKRSNDVLLEYPIILSTTFSARTSLNPREVYDYVIMDEASQVDISTGALALSCAKSAVIVGDVKQLPNVVDSDTHKKADLIREKYSLDKAYDFANKSFLQSLIEVIPDVPQTMLKEHYRCHPRIISFCNQKFYNNELVIMTEDDGQDKSIMAIKTPEGNHRRGNYNQRQIDIIKNEILPTLVDISNDKIGVIAPYNEQVNEIRNQIPGIDVATVHKFQGREKDVIILSTVDDQIKDFTDDPYLLNVAVSRAKKRLIVVVSGNKQDCEGNITDLITYIQYNKLEVIDSQIFSVFDYLYTQYRDKRWEYFQKHKKISQYDSENLTYALIREALQDYPTYDVACFVPLSMVVKDLSSLNDAEVKYLMNPGTHVDFIIFNTLNKQPVLAIETDGYTFHRDGTKQAERDEKKNQILESCGLPLLRLKTNGSQEKERIVGSLSMK